MTDDVLSVRYSPDSRFLAVALLDSTVKVFYQDTLKFYLSLYGHKASRNLLRTTPAVSNGTGIAPCPLNGYLRRF